MLRISEDAGVGRYGHSKSSSGVHSVGTSRRTFDESAQECEIWYAFNACNQHTQRTRPNCKHLGIQIKCTRRVPWSEMVASARRKAPTLEEEYRLFPSLLASKIFPLRAEDCLVRDIRVWHGGCPNLSGEARFLPSIEVSSAAWAEWRRTCMASSIYIDGFPRSITFGGSSTRTIRSRSERGPCCP